MNSLKSHDAWLHLPASHSHNVILEVRANCLILNLGLNTSSLDDLRVTNTRQLQDLRRLDRTTSDEDFLLDLDSVLLASTLERHASGSVAIKLDTLDHGVCKDVKIWSMCVGGEVSTGSIRSHALVWSRPGDEAKGIVEANVVS